MNNGQDQPTDDDAIARLLKGAGGRDQPDLAIAAQPQIDVFLRQKVSEGSPAEHSLKLLGQLAALAQQQPQARGGRK